MSNPDMKGRVPIPLSAILPRCANFRNVTRAFGVIWILNALIQALSWLIVPNASANLIDAFQGAHHHAPAWLKPIIAGVIAIIHSISPPIFAAILAVIALALGVSLIIGRKVALFSKIGIAYCLVMWVLIEALGFPYAGGQTDPGVLIPYAIAFLFVLSTHPVSGSADAPVDRKLWNIASLSFGLLWAFDALLKWLPAFLFHFQSQITGVIPGQPAWVADWLHLVAAMITFIGPVVFASVVALIETVIAAGLLTRRLLWAVIPLGMAYSLAVWVTAEAFGGPYGLSGTGVRGNFLGNVVIYLIPFLFLYTDLVAKQGGLFSKSGS